MRGCLGHEKRANDCGWPVPGPLWAPNAERAAGLRVRRPALDVRTLFQGRQSTWYPFDTLNVDAEQKAAALRYQHW